MFQELKNGGSASHRFFRREPPFFSSWKQYFKKFDQNIMFQELKNGGSASHRFLNASHRFLVPENNILRNVIKILLFLAPDINDFVCFKKFNQNITFQELKNGGSPEPPFFSSWYQWFCVF